REEVAEWKKRDPLTTFEKYVLENQILSADEHAAMQKKIKETVNDATDFAEKAALPDPSTLELHVYH
ncbi:MAG: thiamine pyrophosphate-dependent enzyme, partial [Sulfobacillus sp.]